MGKVMTVEEIEREYDSEWVLLENPTLNEYREVAGGTVLHHSKDRDEVYRKAVELRPKHSAFLYTGSLPEGVEIVL